MKIGIEEDVLTVLEIIYKGIIMAEQVVVKVDGKKVKLYKSTGSLKKIINVGEEIISAILQGDEIHVSTVKGKIRVYSLTGSLRKII